MKNKILMLAIAFLTSSFAIAQSADSAVGGGSATSQVIPNYHIGASSGNVVIYQPQFSCVVYTYHKDGWGYAEGVRVYNSIADETKVVKPSRRIRGWYADVYNCQKNF